MKTYTIGEIYRLKLLKNHKGEPYKDKATVSKILSKYPHRVIQTAFGPGKIFTQETIDFLNKRWA